MTSGRTDRMRHTLYHKPHQPQRAIMLWLAWGIVWGTVSGSIVVAAPKHPLDAPGQTRKTAQTRRAVRTAIPAQYGCSTPVPAPPLPAAMDTFTPPLLGPPLSGDATSPTAATGPAAYSPAVAAFTRTGGPDETITVAGSDFTAATCFLCYGQTRPNNAVTVERAAHVTDTLAASVVLPAQLPAWSTYLLWPQVGTRYGKPIAINRTDAWWLGADKALPGETVAVYGRNLAHGNANALAWIYLKSPGRVAGRWVKPLSVNPYCVSFKVPGLAPGAYEVWTHNGHGGQFGWSGPLALTVLAQSPWAGQNMHIVNVRDYGASGDGVADATAAIQSALNAAGKMAPATVFFPAGTYLINGMVELKPNVSWSGASRDTSIIKAGPSFAASVAASWPALIYADSPAVGQVEFKRLTLDGDGKLGQRSLLIFRHHHDVKLTHCRFNWKGTIGGFNIGSNAYLTISDNEFIGDQVFLADSQQVVVRDNHFRLTDFANAAIISWGGSEVAIVHNHAQDYDPIAATIGGVGAGRFFVAQSHPDSNRHFYIADNTTVNMAPPVGIGDANQGEQILFEVGTSLFTATPTLVTPTTATFASSPPTATAQDAVIVKGRGTGQFRRVGAVNGNTISVAPAWSVLPDKTSVIGVGPAQTRTVVYHNRLDGKGDYAKYETASVAMSMYGNVSDVVFANNQVTHMRSGLVDEYSQVPDSHTPTPSALYFNLMTHNSLDGAYRGLRIVTNSLTENADGTWGHLGNTYRWNTLANLTLQGIHLGADQSGFRGGDLDQDVFEHNTFVNVPTAVWVGKATAWLNHPVQTTFNNLIFYKNTFSRGNAALTGSKALDLTAGRTSQWRAGNRWSGFEASAKDTNVLPAPAHH